MSKEKLMLEVFLDCQGVVHYKLIPEGKTVNTEMHIDILRRLGVAFRKKHLEKRRTNSWFLLRDNAQAHRSCFFKYFLTKNNVTTVDHLPNSHDLPFGFLPVP
jgi:hypothetical protein